MISFPRFRAAALGVAALFLLAGCEPQQEIVARINDDVITSDEFNKRVQSVTTIPPTINTDAGGLTLINMIRDKLTEQLARTYKAVPSDETVSEAAEFQIRSDPNTAAAISAGKLTREDLMRQKKYELEAFGIGTNGDKASEQEIQKAYDQPDVKQLLHFKTAYTIKAMQVPDMALGMQLIAELKKTGDFKAAALKIPGITPTDAASANKEQTMIADQMRPELRDALDKLKPNEITPTPVAIHVADPQQPMNGQTIYAIAQLKSVDKERTLPMNKVRYLLEQVALSKTHPDWQTHYRRELADYTNKLLQAGKIRIGIKRYENLVDSFIQPLAEKETTAHSSGAPNSSGMSASPQ